MISSLASGYLSGLLNVATGRMDAPKTSQTTQESGFSMSMLGGTSSSSSATTSDTMDAATKDALAMLHDMSSGGLEGYWKWVMKKAREDVMAKMGVTEESLKAMDPTARAAMEKKIEEEVTKIVKKAMGLDNDQTAQGADLNQLYARLKQTIQTTQTTAQKGGYAATKDITDILNNLS